MKRPPSGASDLSQKPGSEQPRQPCPECIGKLVPSFHFTDGQALCVSGPLQPSRYEAIAPACAFVVEVQGEALAFVVLEARAAIMHGVGVIGGRAQQRVQIRRRAEGQEMGDHAGDRVRYRRAAGDVHQGARRNRSRSHERVDATGAALIG